MFQQYKLKKCNKMEFSLTESVYKNLNNTEEEYNKQLN